MRRMTLALLLALLLVPAAAGAQIGPRNVVLLNVSPVTTTVNTSATTTSILDVTLPAGALAAGGVHANLIGTISTAPANPGTFTLTANLSGNTFTIANATSPANTIANVPVQIDVYMEQVSAITTQVYMWGCIQYASGVNISRVCNSTSVSSTTVSSDRARNMNVQWAWGTSSAQNAITIMRGSVATGS